MQPTTTSPKLFPKKLAGLLVISLLLLSWKPLSSSFAGFLEELHLKLNQFNNITPASKVYLVSDKPMYEAGDVIWYSVFSRHGNDLANQAAQVTVQLINPQGTVEATQYPDHNSQDNNSKGNFNLKPDQPGGLYKLRAYINNGYQNDNNLAFEKEIQVQDVVLQRLKLTLDFDRKAYGPGDQVTAKVKAFSNSNQPLSGSIFQMIISLNGKQIQQTKGSIDKKGIGRIKFQLPDSIKSNDGHLNLIFDYEGLSESVAKTIPIVLNKVQLSFYPEGGELVNGLQSQLAFRALNEFNKPADVSGEIIDQTGQVVAAFSSFHDGMGEFTFAPEAGKTYQARLTNPAGIKTKYALPEPMHTGYVMQVARPEGEKLKVNVRSALTAKAVLVGQMRGKIFFQEIMNLKPGENKIEIPVAELPIGVLQLTLFDQKTIERAERLVFVNNQKQLNLKIKTDKEKYLPREKVRMTVSASDETGMPIPANIALSVVDDQLLAFVNDKSSNILSWMLVESEIKGKVEEPKFYFDPEEPNAPVALDLLLKTAGWRRFTWDAVKKINLPTYQYSGENLLPKNFYDVKYMQASNYYKEIRGQVYLQNQDTFNFQSRAKLIQYGILKNTAPINENGNFSFGYLQTGKYDLEIEIPGQKTALITGLEIPETGSPYLEINIPTPLKAAVKKANAISKKEKTKISYSAITGDQARITGQILDRNTRQPIIFGTVVVKQNGVQKAFSQTDTEGNYSIAPLKPGNYTIEVPYVGYVAKIVNQVKLKAGQSTNLSLELSPNATQLESVEVVVYREPLIGPEKVGATLTREEIQKSPTREVRTLSYATAAVNTRDDGRNLAVRGNRNQGTVYYVNGVKQLNAPQAKAPVKKIATKGISEKAEAMRPVTEERQKFREAGKVAQPEQEPHNYIRRREFASPVYNTSEVVAERTDFRKTLYWNPLVKIGRSGTAVLEFYTGDDITSYNVLAEGISVDGSPGRIEHKFYSQLPFNVLAKLPNATLENDRISLPLILKNNTTSDVKGKLNVTHPEGWKFIGKLENDHLVKAKSTATFYLDYQVTGKPGTFEFGASFEARNLKDSFKQPVTVEQRGYPISKSIAGSNKSQEYQLDLSNMNPGTAQITFVAYPSVVADLFKGAEGILREPSGCFEQTSSSSYPNLMVLDYLREQDKPDQNAVARANDLLDKGYKKLVTFETKENGYEWFGSAPAHEGLTAYGLMQFTDMQRVGGKVNPDMLERTKTWMLSQRDGKGGFKRNPRSLDSFGRADADITNAYIVYSLAEAGYKDIKPELDQVTESSLKSEDPYQLALVTNALFAAGNKHRGMELLNKLVAKQAPDGSWNGLKHSITYSTGQALQIETTSLAILAILKTDQKPVAQLQNAVKFLQLARNGSGSFGSTQATVLALKAMTNYARFSKRTNEDGTVQFYVDRRKAGEQSYVAGQTGEIQITDLNKYFDKPGNYAVKVQFEKTNSALPYSVALDYYSNMPPSSSECKVKLETSLAETETNVGNTIRYIAKIKNLKSEGLPMTMAIVGIPAGLSVQPAQLKELQEKKVIDFYEITGNRLICYFRDMAPSEEVVVNLDLKAEFPGTYESPAGTAYLYYTNEHKNWVVGSKITVKP